MVCDGAGTPGRNRKKSGTGRLVNQLRTAGNSTAGRLSRKLRGAGMMKGPVPQKAIDIALPLALAQGFVMLCRRHHGSVADFVLAGFGLDRDRVRLPYETAQRAAGRTRRAVQERNRRSQPGPAITWPLPRDLGVRLLRELPVLPGYGFSACRDRAGRETTSAGCRGCMDR